MTLTSAQIATSALREIGVYSPYDEAPDASQFAIALDRLEMLLDELTGTEKLWFFSPSTQSMALTSGTATYAMNALLSTDLQFVTRVRLLRESEELPVTLLRKSDYEALRGTDAETAKTYPDSVYIERKDNPNLICVPTPAETGLVLKISGFTYANDVANDGGEVDHGFPAAWERYLSRALAADIGSGPVVTLPKNERDDKKAEAKAALKSLKTSNNRENVRKMRVTKPRSF